MYEAVQKFHKIPQYQYNIKCQTNIKQNESPITVRQKYSLPDYSENIRVACRIMKKSFKWPPPFGKSIRFKAKKEGVKAHPHCRLVPLCYDYCCGKLLLGLVI